MIDLQPGKLLRDDEPGPECFRKHIVGSGHLEIAKDEALILVLANGYQAGGPRLIHERAPKCQRRGEVDRLAIDFRQSIVPEKCERVAIQACVMERPVGIERHWAGLHGGLELREISTVIRLARHLDDDRRTIVRSTDPYRVHPGIGGFFSE